MAEVLHPPVTAQILNGQDEGLISLELEDGTIYQGYSFGAKKSVAGELVGLSSVSRRLLKRFAQIVSWLVTYWRTL